MHHTKLVAICLVIVLLVSPCHADDYDNFCADYLPHWERATEHFWTNVRVKGVRKIYDTEGPGNYQATESFEAVAGKNTLLYRIVVSDDRSGQSPHAERGGASTIDAAYAVSRPTRAGQYAIFETGYPWTKSSYFGRYGATESGLGWPFKLLYMGVGPNRYREKPKPNKMTFTVNRRKFRGLECVAATTASQRENGFSRTTYLRLPDWLVIGEEGVGVFQVSSRSTQPIKKYVEVNYGPPQPDTGLPFPTEVKGWYTTPAGKRFPAEDVTFTQYERYVPKPGEVDVEKQFGVTVPPVPPRPPLPPEGEYLTFEEPARTSDAQGNVIAARRVWPVWPLYVVVGLVAVGIVGVILRRRAGRS